MKRKSENKKETIGIDLGDKKHSVCALNEVGEIVEERDVANNKESLRRLSRKYEGAVMVMEVGMN